MMSSNQVRFKSVYGASGRKFYIDNHWNGCHIITEELCACIPDEILKERRPVKPVSLEWRQLLHGRPRRQRRKGTMLDEPV